MVARSGGLFDVSLTEMLGFEQVPCCESDHSITDQEFHSFISLYQIKDYENAISMVYEQHTGCSSDENTESFALDDATSLGSQTDSEENVSDSEDDMTTTSSFTSNSGASLMRRRSNSTSSESSELHSVTKWYGMFIPAENALYLESPSTSELHSDCLTDILDVAECMNAFKVYIGIPRNRLDVVRQYLFAGFEISKKGRIEKQTPASVHAAQSTTITPHGTPAGSNHILLEYEL
mmetsp:Transcript_3712/g.14109  ORF Transcript_3712/g.14109 Transcript_3712/m.14109 type:complete len:235 (-) Transcript_3712:323-1027(-)|eukprot:CAMPEP_0117440378 /NCGR_PEP_ID=MMETSP0759-20121206/3060_1 /TAXON_ID=63605 /ORGANISM="Percolomonas cosmopolitus, Strain WS" /LENGTH=234 /DNA_ID=CAMNT_0005232143 /DNA_START=1398 /DNA_END=2102 /DNA_ORIENTATION=+